MAKTASVTIRHTKNARTARAIFAILAVPAAYQPHHIVRDWLRLSSSATHPPRSLQSHLLATSQQELQLVLLG